MDLAFGTPRLPLPLPVEERKSTLFEQRIHKGLGTINWDRKSIPNMALSQKDIWADQKLRKIWETTEQKSNPPRNHGIIGGHRKRHQLQSAEVKRNPIEDFSGALSTFGLGRTQTLVDFMQKVDLIAEDNISIYGDPLSASTPLGSEADKDNLIDSWEMVDRSTSYSQIILENTLLEIELDIIRDELEKTAAAYV